MAQHLYNYFLQTSQDYNDQNNHKNTSFLIGLVRFQVIIIMFATFLLSWRVWAFTIKPTFRSNEPPELPYWIPVIGHALSFFRDTEGLLTYGRLYFGDTREPFGITVAGQTIYVLTSPQDVTQVYKNAKTLTFYEYVQDVMRSLGVSERGIEKLWQNTADPKTSKHAKKSLAEAGEDYYREQFLPGPHLDELWQRVIQLLDVHVTWEHLVKSATHASLDVSLLNWTQDTLLEVVVEALFGDQLVRLEPRLLEYFAAFDDQSWKLTYKYPRRVSKDMYQAKDNMVAAIEEYLALPKAQRSQQAWLISKLEIETKNAGIDAHDLASMITSLLWVILSNAYKLCFWFMAYLLFEPDLYNVVKAEIDQAVSQGLPGLEARLDECPCLVSIYWEVLRLSSSSTAIRTVESPTPLGRYIFPSKSKLLLPFRQLHFNEEAFGANVNIFNPDRFRRDPGLSKSPSFRPFGGGSTYCPGRHVARREVLVFIALAISRFDLRLNPEYAAKFPELDTKKPSLGMMMPVKGQDVRVLVSRREQK